MIKRFLGLSLLLTLLFTVATVTTGSIIVYRYTNSFLTSAGLTIPIVHTTLKQASPKPTANILLLGLDKRADTLETTLLTDSLLFARYNATTATATLIPLPRDLWIPDLRTKINSLYYYGVQNGSNADFVTSQVSSLTGQPIPYYMIIDYQVLPQAIDMVGGVDLVVQRSFTDTQFPNPAYITDPTQPIYQTVTFVAGPTHMDGTTALTYMRSRHSADQAEGSDEARSARQLLVFQSLVKKITDPTLLSDPTKLGQLYRFYKSAITTNLPDSDLISLAWSTFPNHQIIIRPISIMHLLTNPPLTKYGQWVYEQRDTSGKQLQDFISSSLN